MAELRVVVVEPMLEPELRHIPDTLKSMQDVVGGLIDVVHVKDNIDLVCNDEGLLLDMPPNRLINNRVLIAGPFFLVGANVETGDFVSLTLEQAEEMMKVFSSLIVEVT